MEIRQVNGTRVICVLVLLACALFYYQTYSFPVEKGPIASEYGSAFFPQFLLLFMAASAIALLVQSALGRPRGSAQVRVSLQGGSLGRSLGLWLLCLGFYLAWSNLGYLYTAPLFMIGAGLILAARNMVVLAFLAALGPLLYLVFDKLLNVAL